MPKQQKLLTYTFYVGGKQVDALTDEQLDRMAERLGRAMSLYYRKHPDEYRVLLENDRRREEGQKETGKQPGA